MTNSPPAMLYHFGPAHKACGLAESQAVGLRAAFLAEFANLNTNVPPGFVLTVDTCSQLSKGKLPVEVATAIGAALAKLADDTGQRLGDASNPLILSVRPSPRHAISGTMEAILNIGLNDQTVEGFARHASDPSLAFDCYRRLVQNYAHVVLGDDATVFDDLIGLYLGERGYASIEELKGSDARDLMQRFQAQVESHGEAFPQDVMQQLTSAIIALARTWSAPRAKTNRKIMAIAEEDAGLAIIVQVMRFGNRAENSGAGIATLHTNASGDTKLAGNWWSQAQGPDRLTTIRPPVLLDQFALDLPEAANDLMTALEASKAHFRDFMEVEFTVEQGKLSLLDVKPQPRSPALALAMAVALVEQELIDEGEALLRIDPLSLGPVLHTTIDPTAKKDVMATGLPASPGAATGAIIFDTEDARRRAAAGERIILVRSETLPEDIRALSVVEGILTTRGGTTSHAAVIARGMGKPCVAGAGSLRIDTIEETLTAPGFTLKKGDLITIDGSSGQVLLGEVAILKPSLSGDLALVLSWADRIRRMKVRANAETPQEARIARDFGAEGIGLCRTEHMFFDGDRIVAMREMILADRERDRRAALAKILPMLKKDFITLFEIMAHHPVTLRLLDPPLHEFLPEGGQELEAVAQSLGVPAATLRKRVVELQEQNPMLGHRGVRLLLTYPEITDMQARAIFEAAAEVFKASGKMPVAEIMVPLVASRAELELVKTRIVAVATDVEAETGVKLVYHVGTMIELPRAALKAADIAQAADFFSFGTNDLTQTTFGISRDDSGRFIGEYTSRGILAHDPFVTIDREGVGELIKFAIARGREMKPELALGICGEHGGDPDSIAFWEELGLDYVSCSPFRVPIARLAAAQATLHKGDKIVINTNT